MKIKRVEIVGFKSFVDKVSLDFQEGVVGIVGPNGCGKSNIVDAIRWAMGEQSARNLRGRAMEDVIFGGSESRRPLGMAEVSMTFANDDGLAPPAFRDYAEIMVTRRLHRNGDSEYLLNKTPCRLLDISELFMDTGVGARAYSIIEQGKIGMILNAKPEERRSLIEEAAGVTKFKARKKTALRKIEATRQNLLRLGDIIAEVRRQSSNLKRQARKAERFREYREELRGIETRLAAGRYRDLLTQLEENGSREEQLQRTLGEQEAGLAAEEARLAELRLQQVAREKEVASAQERVFHLAGELQKAESRIEFGGREIENQVREGERLAGEAADVERRLEDLDREEEQLQAGREQLGRDLAAEADRLAEVEGNLQDVSGREQDCQASLDAARSALYGLLTELTRFGSQQEEAQRRLQSHDQRFARSRAEALGVREQMEELRRQQQDLEETLGGFRQRRRELVAEREACREHLQRLREQAEDNEARLLVQRENHSRARSRLESLRELEASLEGYGRGVQVLLGDAELRSRFEGLVADALEVPGRYEAAVEAALGDRLQTVLARNADDAAAALAFLRHRDHRCSLLLPGFEPAAGSPPPQGEPLASLVGLREGAPRAVLNLLRGTWLVPELEPFLAGGVPPGTTLVTEAGELLTASGEWTGGARTPLDQGLLHKKREIKDLEGEVVALGEAVATLQDERSGLQQARGREEERQRELDAALHQKELKVAGSEKDLTRLQEEMTRLDDRLEVLSFEETQLHEEEEELRGLLDAASRGRSEREQEKQVAEERVAALQEELQVLRRQAEEIRERATALKMKVVSLREREEGDRQGLDRLARLRGELRGRLALLTSRQEETVAERGRLAGEIEKSRTELDVLYRRREEEQKRLDALRERFEAVAAEAGAGEEGLRALRGRVNQLREELAAAHLRRQEVQLEADHLRETIRERHRIDLADFTPEPQPGLDAGSAGRRSAELRRLIEEMGEVNLTAIEEFEELETRHGFLSTQQQDLQQSLHGLQTAIAKINRTTRKRFRETFDQVNAKFQEVFPRLFRGGRAELQLTDENDLLETGIEIIVQPPGKKLQNVGLLSGGEKALTAVALIFSIFLIKPSPFCLLDEVDAPLDDANIGRFNDMVREMVDTSQFIIITHNKRTMEIADTLYGVTMEEPGVSKLVSVRINDF